MLLHLSLLTLPALPAARFCCTQEDEEEEENDDEEGGDVSRQLNLPFQVCVRLCA